MSKIVVKQVRSAIGRNQRVRDTLQALGLGKIGKSKELASNPAVEGMIAKVSHLLEVERKK